jgi:hypothetical protein
VGDKERDLELKEIKIGSLEDILKKKEPIPVPSPRVNEKQKEKINLLQDKITKLTQTKAKLENKIERAEEEATAKLKEQN